jgi:hypothetical protein
MDWNNIIPSSIIGICGLIITVILTHRTQKLQNDKLFKELFAEFTKRYDTLNGRLYDFQRVSAKIQKDGFDMLDEEHRNYHVLYQSVMDFFNLCAEEYYWYKKGRIEEMVWKSWYFGMNYWYQEVPEIRKLWDLEMKNPYWRMSYYLKDGDQFFEPGKIIKDAL